MNPAQLKEELLLLSRMLRDATVDYETRLRESGQVDLSNEWRYNMGDILGDVPHVAEQLVAVYTASPEDMPDAMKEFLEAAAGETGLFHCPGHMRRLNDVLEGRPPSWPVDPGPWPPADDQ